LFFFLVLTVMLQKFWGRYSVNPTRTIVKSFHVPIFKVPFPAITICPLIPPMASRRRKVFQSLRVPHNMTNSTVKFLVRYKYFFYICAIYKINDPNCNSAKNNFRVV